MISVIIPIYNCSPYLERCLSSVASQSFRQWECILVDDGSTDGSGELCDAWGKKDNRFRVVHQPNTGVSAARNRGMAIAGGEWFCFIDSDDWVEPNFLAVMAAHTAEADLILSGQIREWAEGHTTIYHPERDECFSLDSHHADTFTELNRRFLLYAPHEKFYRADLIREQQLQFPVGCQYGEDLIFVYRYLEHVKTISTIATALYHYRMGQATLSTIFRPNQFDEDYGQWKVLELFFRRHQLLNHRAQCYLCQRLWGIVYDGIFLYPKLSRAGKAYLDNILGIPEIDILKRYEEVFPCAWWIKQAVAHRCSMPFFLYFISRPPHKRERNQVDD